MIQPTSFKYKCPKCNYFKIVAKNSAESIANDIQSSLFNSIDEMIADTFNNLIIGFKDTSKKLNTDNSTLLSNKESLQSLSNSLINI